MTIPPTSIEITSPRAFPPSPNDGTTHGTAYSYDAHVPVIFMGPGIAAGRFDETIAVNDIAPTLATMLGVETPSGSVGRVLREIFDRGNGGREHGQ